MTRRIGILFTLTLMVVVTPAFGDGVATLNLSSSVDGQAIAPGQPIDWTISVALSSGDNAGLAQWL